MVAVTLCTSPGTPRPGYGSTCPHARPIKLSPDDGVYHQNHLWPLPEERVMAPHQVHQIGASSPVSWALLVPSGPHPADISLHMAVSPTLAKSVLSGTPPHAREVPNMHMHKTTNTRSYQYLSSYI
jgi:hypothetical protein